MLHLVVSADNVLKKNYRLSSSISKVKMIKESLACCEYLAKDVPNEECAIIKRCTDFLTSADIPERGIYDSHAFIVLKRKTLFSVQKVRKMVQSELVQH